MASKKKKKRSRTEKSEVKDLIVVSDMHCGCQLGLFPSERIKLDEAGWYSASRLQRKVWGWWEEFWGEWVPKATKGKPYSICINGDPLDGVHHNSTHQVSHNLEDQKKIALEILKPLVKLCEGRLYVVRGTEVHGGKSGHTEESLARELKAIPGQDGKFARYELWIEVGRGLCHIMHHIGTTGRTHYESSAPMGELAEEYTEAGRSRRRPPDAVIRSHRHRDIEIRVPTELGDGIAAVTAGWQLKTPFVYRTAGGRVTTPQIGGRMIRDNGEEFYSRKKVWNIARGRIEKMKFRKEEEWQL